MWGQITRGGSKVHNVDLDGYEEKAVLFDNMLELYILSQWMDKLPSAYRE
jgi:hypothetical protein